jgi:hypothetical protein
VRRLFPITVTGLCLAAWLLPAKAWCSGAGTFDKSQAEKKSESACGKFGTSVEFLGPPTAAARKAKQEEKLVFVLHVSGHFEDPRFT